MTAPNPPADVHGVPFGDDYSHRYEREQLGFREAAWLRAKGWKHTSSTPGCFWLWMKTIEPPHATQACPAGTVILVDQDMALTLQERMDGLEADLAAPPEAGEGGEE